jgi:hypothetical protein
MITFNRGLSSSKLHAHHYRKIQEPSFSHRALQLVSLLGAIFLLSRASFSLFGEYFGSQMLIPSYKAYGLEIDQNTRILGGMWSFVSFSILWCIPRIGDQDNATLCVPTLEMLVRCCSLRRISRVLSLMLMRKCCGMQVQNLHGSFVRLLLRALPHIFRMLHCPSPACC